jgi:hypothetical protein
MDVDEVRRRSNWVKRWRSSGASAAEFAAAHDLKASHLYAWSRDSGRAAGDEIRFAEVRARDLPSSEVKDSTPIEIAVRDCVIRVRTGADLELLEAVLAMVSRC